MNKIRRILIMLLFALIVVGVNIETANIKAASAKDFKGDLNAIYKNSESVKSSITFNKVNSKKVTAKIVVNGTNQGKFSGNIISKDTSQIKLDVGEKVQLKWKDKSTFTAKRPSGGFSDETITMSRLLCYALQDKTYTAKTKSSGTIYYSGNLFNKKDSYKLGAIRDVSFKGNKMIVKGSLIKASKKDYLYDTTKRKYCSNKKRTFNLTSKTKFYRIEEFTKIKISKSEIKKYRGLDMTIKVKNGKVEYVALSS